jgi:protein subunit release factor A
MREYKELGKVTSLTSRYRKLVADMESAREMIRDEADLEMKEFAREELDSLTAEEERLREEVRMALIPKDPNDTRDVIVEIRAGTGGDEKKFPNTHRRALHHPDRRRKTHSLAKTPTSPPPARAVLPARQ